MSCIFCSKILREIFFKNELTLIYFHQPEDQSRLLISLSALIFWKLYSHFCILHIISLFTIFVIKNYERITSNKVRWNNLLKFPHILASTCCPNGIKCFKKNFWGLFIENKILTSGPPPLITFTYVLNSFATIYFCNMQSAKKIRGNIAEDVSKYIKKFSQWR